jgi:periplasmic divalent cation tolerance protein
MERIMSEEIVIFVTTGSTDEAQRIARTLVDEKLIACANLVPSVRSLFRWQGKVCDEAETLMIMKTVAANLEVIASRVKAMHSYQVPEIIALPIVGGSAEYLKWVHEETESEVKSR